MATLVPAPPRTAAARLVSAGAALLTLACLVLAYFDFFVTTSDNFRGPAEYVYTLDGLPFVGALLLVVAGLRAVHGGRDGTLGTAGFAVTAVGVLALAACLLASVVTASENSLGPLYPLGSLISFVGVILYAVAAVRARVLPWYAAPALAVTWIVGGPVGDNGPLGFPASGLLLAAVAITLAVLVNRRQA
jgi:hypothetical protein